jgi:hypothetical protein
MSDLTTTAIEQARPAVERAFRAVYNLVEYAQDLNSRVPEALTDEQIFNLGFTDTSLFRQQYNQMTKQLQGEAAGRLAEFYGAWCGLVPLASDRVHNRLIAAWPEKVYWAGIDATSPITWVAACTLSIDHAIRTAAGLASLNLSQCQLKDEDMAKMIQAWNKVRQDLGTLPLPPAGAVRIGLDQAFAMVATKQDERQLQERLLAALAVDQPDEKPPAEGAYLSAKDLAARFEVDYESLRSRLRYWRKNHPDLTGKGWMEVQDRGSRDPGFLYRVMAVEAIVLQARTSGTSPAKKKLRSKLPEK